MAKNTIFALEKNVRQSGTRRKARALGVIDDGLPIDLRYAWDAYPAASALSVGWTEALDDDVNAGPAATREDAPASETVDDAEPGTEPDEATTEAQPDPAPTTVPSTPKPTPSQPLPQPVVVDPTDPTTKPRTQEVRPGEDRPTPVGDPPAPSSTHDDKFMRALSAAARGEQPEPRPPETEPDEDVEDLSPRSRHSHAIFEQLGDRLSHATTFDAGAFTAEKLFDRLDSQMEAERKQTGDIDVVRDLAALLDVPEDQVRSGLLVAEDDDEDQPSPSGPRLASDKPPSSSRLVGSDDGPSSQPAQPGKAVARITEKQDETDGPPAGAVDVLSPDAVFQSGQVVEASSATPFERLLNYLGLDEATFAAQETGYFAALKDHLMRAGTIADAATVNRSNFHEHVAAFQRSASLSDDGLPGQDTLWALQRDWALSRNLNVRRVDADVWLRPPLTEAEYDPDRHGYRSFRFREDAATLYEALRADVLAEGAIITSAGSFRDLGATVTAGRSSKSMHYSGLAFDLAPATGMRNPNVDPYIITEDGSRWRVWARTDSGTEQTLNAVVWSSGSTSTRSVTAHVIDFTALAERHGFSRIGPRSTFPANYGSAEWWHFQANSLLVPWVSQFGIELLSLDRYSEAQVQAAAGIWQNRKAIFKRQPYRRGWH